MNKIYLYLLAITFAACTTSSVDEGSNTTPSTGGGSTTEDITINNYVDNLLESNYLWNDEYKSLTRNTNQEYDTFFNSTLLSMSSNTLDKKLYGDEYYLFSYIDRTANSTTSLATRATTATKYNTLGFVSFTASDYYEQSSNGTISSYVLFVVNATYPDTPASQLGIKHGDIIIEINGEKITNSNYASLYSQLIHPTSSCKLLLAEITTNAASQTILTPRESTVSLSVSYTELNPILKSELYTEGEHKIGYLCYEMFDIAYDSELIECLKTFKSEGISDMILDMRYNGGGYVSSSNLLSSAIAGSACEDQIFMYYRFNDDRMLNASSIASSIGASEKDGNIYSKFYTTASEYRLDLPRLYCITGSYTASASELVINSLRGINMEVILIGEQSMGKNVGMEVHDKSVDNYTYEIAPISFQNYNSQWFTDYASGFEPEYELGEYDTLPLSDLGRGEYLLEQTISLITSGTLLSMTRSEESTNPLTLLSKGESAPNRSGSRVIAQ